MGHIFLIGRLHGIALGFPIAPLQGGNHAFEGGLIGAGFKLQPYFLRARAVKKLLFYVLGQLPIGGIHGEAVKIRQRLEHLMGGAARLAAVPAHAGNRPLVQGKGGVGNNQLLAHLHQRAQAAAHRARAIGIIEGKHPGGAAARRDESPAGPPRYRWRAFSVYPRRARRPARTFRRQCAPAQSRFCAHPPTA